MTPSLFVIDSLEAAQNVGAEVALLAPAIEMCPIAPNIDRLADGGVRFDAS